MASVAATARMRAAAGGFAIGVAWREALEKRDEELASAWKESKEKTHATESKLKLVALVEEENGLLKAGVEKSAVELVDLKRHYAEWVAKFEKVTAKKAELEKFIEEFSVEHCEKLNAFSVDAEQETTRIDKDLDPKRGLLNNSAALALLMLEACVDYILGCFKWL
ncbi:hypothetical protein ZWY2020_029442 [Hordeum vulgare]|nr:hypothetical protein ZWY2020_029442 [Hordeum vulgare]